MKWFFSILRKYIEKKQKRKEKKEFLLYKMFSPKNKRTIFPSSNFILNYKQVKESSMDPLHKRRATFSVFFYMNENFSGNDS